MTQPQASGRSSTLIGRCRVERAVVDSGASAAAGESVTSGPTTVGLACLPDISVGEIAAYVALLDSRSFTAAAKRLYLSQPGLSARISRLERALGVVLIDRSTRELTLTRAGVAFASTAYSVLRLLAPPHAAHGDANQTGATRPPTQLTG